MRNEKNKYETLVVAELNVNLGKTSSTDKIEKICDILVQNKPDIIFLTEFNLSIDDDMYKKLEKIIEKDYRLCHGANELVVAIKPFLIDENEFGDIGVKKYALEILPIPKIKGYNIKIAGIRFDISNVEDPTKRILEFFDYIYEDKPDLIIGDYNWHSIIIKKTVLEEIIDQSNRKAENSDYKKIFMDISNLEIPIKRCSRGYKSISAYHDEYEDVFCRIISSLNPNSGETSYDIWPTDLKNADLFSKKGIYRDKKWHYSRPDRVIWNRSKVKIKSLRYIQVDGFDHDKMIEAELLIRE